MSSKPVVLQFVFDDFESQPHQTGEKARSEKSDGRGNSWQLVVFPGGKTADENVNGDSYIGLFLYLREGGNANAQVARVAFTIRDAAGQVHKHTRVKKYRYSPALGYGNKKVTLRSSILDKSNNILFDGGSLVIDVTIQIITGKRKFQPTNPSLKNIQALCGSDNHSDVKFKIGKTIIPAHKFILSVNAPILRDFCGKKRTPVVIEDTSPGIFRLVLQYVYGGDVPSEEKMLEEGKKLIEAADRYDIVGLKMVVENALVDQRIIDLDTVVDWLMFADAKSCPLLKEYALSYATCKVKDVMAHKSWKDLRESPELLEELMMAMSKEQSNDLFSQAGGLSVDELRAKLETKGLDVDGSKEVLAKRLEASEQSDGESGETTTIASIVSPRL